MKHPHPGKHELIARGVITRGGALLVNHGRNAKPGQAYYALPGGHIDPGESSTETVRREVEEELQAQVSVGDLLFVTESIYPGRHEHDGRRHEIVLYFAAQLLGGLVEQDGRIISPEGDKNFQWLPLAQLAQANLLPRTAKKFLAAMDVTPAGVAAPQPSAAVPLYGFSDDT